MFNAQGDVVGIIDQNGSQVVSYDYSAWGEVLEISGTMADTLGQTNPIRYRGYYYDNETGFYYLQSRYYDPVICRFINADGLVSTGQGVLGYNMFAYCGNNPVNFVDPTGEFPSAAVVVPLIFFVKISIENLIKTVEKLLLDISKRKDDILCVAQTIYGEAGGYEKYPNDWKQGQEAVAWTIINRYNSSQYPNDWYKIVSAEMQFTGYKPGKEKYETGNIDTIMWDYAYNLAMNMVYGKFNNIPYPAGFTDEHMYFRTDENQSYDSWGGILRIGGNVFFYYK